MQCELKFDYYYNLAGIQRERKKASGPRSNSPSAGLSLLKFQRARRAGALSVGGSAFPLSVFRPGNDSQPCSQLIYLTSPAPGIATRNHSNDRRSRRGDVRDAAESPPTNHHRDGRKRS